MKSKIKVNFIYLSILQAINYILPLFMIPFLISKLGLDGFGIISFALATVTIFRVITSYGFDLTASRDISKSRSDKLQVDVIFSTVIVARLLLSVICFLFLLVLLLIFPAMRESYLIFLLSFIVVFGDVLFPVWFFQGVEDMKYITLFRALYKLIYAVLVFLFVTDSADAFMVPFFDGIGSIVVGIISLIYIRRNFGVRFINPNWQALKQSYKDGFDVFISKVMVVFYTSFNTFLLGVMTTPLVVGYYSIAERIYSAVRGILNPFIQAVFPHLSRLYSKNKLEYKTFEKKITFRLSLVLAIFSVVMYSSSNYLHVILETEVNETAIICVKLFSVAIFFALGGYFSSLLVIKNRGKKLRNITIKTVLLNSILIYPLIINFEAIGAVYCFLITQLYHLYLQAKERRND